MTDIHKPAEMSDFPVVLEGLDSVCNGFIITPHFYSALDSDYGSLVITVSQGWVWDAGPRHNPDDFDLGCLELN